MVYQNENFVGISKSLGVCGNGYKELAEGTSLRSEE